MNYKEFTIYELTLFAKGAAARDWEQTALIAALINNAHFVKKKSIDDFNPYSTKRKVPIKKPISDLAKDYGSKIVFN